MVAVFVMLVDYTPRHIMVNERRPSQHQGRLHSHVSRTYMRIQRALQLKKPPRCKRDRVQVMAIAMEQEVKLLVMDVLLSTTTLPME